MQPIVFKPLERKLRANLNFSRPHTLLLGSKSGNSEKLSK